MCVGTPWSLLFRLGANTYTLPRSNENTSCTRTRRYCTYLHGAEGRVHAVVGQELRVGADLGDALVGDDGDAVGVLDRGQAVRDHNRRVHVDLVQTVKRFLHHLLWGRGAGR